MNPQRLEWDAEVVQEYGIQVEQWEQAPAAKFMGMMQEDVRYGVGLTPEDLKKKGCYYLKIQIEKKLINNSIAETIFYARMISMYMVRLNEKEPTEEFIYSVVERAAAMFSVEFERRADGGNFRIPQKPTMEEMRSTITTAISVWKRKYRHDPVDRPDWQSRFRDLPEIPLHKQWRLDSRSTLEQDISYKLMNRHSITPEEEAIFIELLNFYDELDKKLAVLDYESFSVEDFEKFKNYIFFAFNYLILITNGLTVFHTVRLVVNEVVQGKDEPITETRFLKYPPLAVVKKGQKYNRASTFNTTVFYSTENVDTALKEIRPPLNKLVTVGVWRPKDANKALVSFPISHSDAAIKVNEGVQKATAAFNDSGKYNSPLFMEFMSRFLKVLGREFSKVVVHHYGYLISALLSERIFDREPEDNRDFQYDCIVYPSVGNDYLVNNIAVKASTIDKDFRLVGVVEFRIEEAYYDRPYTLNDPFKITLAKVKEMRWAKSITEVGEIIW
jgi:hypothetical protein